MQLSRNVIEGLVRMQRPELPERIDTRDPDHATLTAELGIDPWQPARHAPRQTAEVRPAPLHPAPAGPGEDAGA